jgi:multidrug efflux pump
MFTRARRRARAIRSKKENASLASPCQATACLHVRVTQAFTGVDAIASVAVQANGQIFRLGDIATVKRGYEDPPTFIVRANGKPALGLGVSMQGGAEIITLGR